MGDPLSRPARLCRTLLKVVYALFAAAAALLALFWLTAVVGEIIVGSIFLTVEGLLCLLPFLSAAGVICGIAAAVRERRKRYLAMAAAFLPPGVIAGLVVCWAWYAASHY